MNVRNGAPVRIGALELNFLLDETQGSRDLGCSSLLSPLTPASHYPTITRMSMRLSTVWRGVFTMTVDGETHEIAPGDSLFVGRGRVHHFSNPSPTTARVLAVLNPGSIGKRYFEEIAHEVNVPGKPDLTKVAEIMQRHGLVPRLSSTQTIAKQKRRPSGRLSSQPTTQYPTENEALRCAGFSNSSTIAIA